MPTPEQHPAPAVRKPQGPRTTQDARRGAPRFDPLMLARFRPLLSPEGWLRLRMSIGMNIAMGVVEGLAMLSLLPIATALTAEVTASAVPEERAPFGVSLVGWLWILAALAVLGGVVRYVDSLVGYLAATDFIRRGHLAVGEQLSVLPLGWFDRKRTGEISHLVSSGFMSAGQTLAHTMSLVVGNAATLATLCIGSWCWDWRLGLTLTCSFPAAFALMLVARRIRAAANRPLAPADAEMASRVVEYAACQPALRAAGRSSDFAPLEAARAANDRARFRELWLSTAGVLLNGVSVQAVVVAIIAVVGGLAASGQMTAAAVVAFVGLLLRFAKNIGTLGESQLGVEEARIPLERAEEILDAEPLPEPDAPVAPGEPGGVEIRDVRFGYAPDRPVLDGVSMTLRPGTVTAVVGPSGSGKTTLARLIARFWDVDSGSISVGGVDIREMPVEQLMAQLSMVFQDVYLFDDTLEANVRVGRPDATREEMLEAADRAGVSAIAARLPDGWETRVGEGGRSLSGGERQRVSIARALLKRAPIVLFDEATSALDAGNEANVLASVDELRAGSTFLVIAHKLDTIRSADHIVVLDERGGIAEEGDHERLHAAGGPYRRYWDRRAAAAGWTLASRG
ncbi:ABC transporter ATP-binding protein [Gulosibacter sp. 10]|uniref:ABC transporter ATP-binding protein n=1 Tax=Gulosibacter sp. 10 TaxID=1255570 RepID=UPI00097F035B|nr:ABC transporter ATP-binding protein [Gulosibacter sp. 10]SJM61600.1 ABC transporter ATP-binding protein [Gulosibacter sp. 10]